MTTCAVYGCFNNSATTTDPTVQYYHFPQQHEIAQQWIRACSWQENTIDLNTGVRLPFKLKQKLIFE